MNIPGPKVSVVIRYVTSVSDGMGGYTDTYTTRHTLNVGFHSLTAQERLMAGRESALITNRVFMEYKSDIEQSDEVVYDGQTYEIVAIVDPAQKHKHLELDLRLVK